MFGRVRMQKVFTFAKDESGATAIEYGLIAALVGVGIIVGAGVLGTNLNSLFNNIGTKLNVTV